MNKWIDGIKYDGKYRCYRPRTLSSVVCFPSRKQAVEYAKANSIPQVFIVPTGSRFWRGFGFRDDHGRMLIPKQEDKP